MNRRHRGRRARRLTTAAQANAWMRSEPDAAREFREARGDVEFTTGGACVQTTSGWREMKVGISRIRPTRTSSVMRTGGPNTIPGT
ncbi:MAG: hypothetical protein AB7U20_21660, partial [Planctomycetaceae bacterium]